MKKTLLMCLSVFIFISFIQVGNLNAQHEKSQNITVNPVGLVFGLLTVEYEKALSEKNSFTIRGNFLSRDIGDIDTTIFGAGGSYRFFPKKVAPSGLYYGPSADVVYAKAKSGSASASGVFFFVGGDGGYKWIFKGGFVVDAGVSVGFYFGKLEVGYTELDFGGFTLGLRLGLGYAWD
jgi:hypothetical protein